MPIDFKVVVSAENSSYIAWQTQLFCFSALTRLGKRPTVIVHRSAAPLLEEFEIVRAWGCPVVEAPQFRIHPRGEYPPRNEVGSLLTVACLPEFREGFVLFCEPDMLFVKPVTYSGELCGEYYGYIDYKQERIAKVARNFGMEDKLDILNRISRIGVPYLIPASIVSSIARRWLQVLDSIEELGWVDIMYAYGVALALEGQVAQTTYSMTDNKDPLKQLDRFIIHYCYGDWRWNKRTFRDGQSPLREAPMPSAKGLRGTVLGEILLQIRQARAYHRFPRSFKAVWQLAETAR